MREIEVREIPKGGLFRLKDSERSLLWIRGYYDRTSDKYECYSNEDINKEIFCRGNRKVFVED